jgi:hypothetical protein
MRKMSEGMKVYLSIGASIIITAVILIGFMAVVIDNAGKEKSRSEELESIQAVHPDQFNTKLFTDEKLQSGFINTEECMASFTRFVQSPDDVEIFMIQVERWGFENPLYYEVSTFDEAVLFLEGLR